MITTTFKKANDDFNRVTKVEDIKDLEMGQTTYPGETTDREVPLSESIYGAGYKVPLVSPEEAKRIKGEL